MAREGRLSADTHPAGNKPGLRLLDSLPAASPEVCLGNSTCPTGTPSNPPKAAPFYPAANGVAPRRLPPREVAAPGGRHNPRRRQFLRSCFRDESAEQHTSHIRTSGPRHVTLSFVGVARNSPGVVQRERRFWRTSQSMTTGCCWALLPEDNDDRIRPRLALRCGTKQKIPGSRRGLCSVRE